MEPDPEFTRQLLETFEIELGELSQGITGGLLQLEKKHSKHERQQILQEMFRAAHNIKGAAKGVGIEAIADMSHRLESIFSAFRKDDLAPDQGIITLCLETLDCMKESMRAFVKGEGTLPGVGELCARLDRALSGGEVVPAGKLAHHAVQGGQQSLPKIAENMLRVATDRVNEIEDHAEELQAIKITLGDELAKVRLLHGRMGALAKRWLAALPLLKRPDTGSMTEEIRQLFVHGVDTIASLGGVTAEIRKSMQVSQGQLGRLGATLHDDLRRLQLMPAATLLRPLARMVRDTAITLGKEVDLQIIGDDISVDRAVLDRLHDPLMHLVRNAIDHGIETPEERLAQGKSKAGHLVLRVCSEGNQVLISVEDDGCGIDADRVAAVAVERQLASQEELDGMSRDEVLHLVLKPGFSTREVVTDVSGRGVGMDVAQTNLAALGGNIRLDTAVGKGTTVTMRVPLTLATEHGLIVRASGTQFAIPVIFIDRIMYVAQDEVMEVEGTQAVRVGGNPVPLRGLANVLELGHDETENGAGLNVIVIRSGWRSVAFAVDDIEGEREMVIKPLRPPLWSVRNVKGCTLSGSGGIIMVLDTADLVASALGKGASAYAVGRPATGKTRQSHVLVVDDSVTTRMLEKNILETRGFKVTVAVDGREAWDLIQSREFDLVVTDIEMPEMNGFALTEHIKKSEKYAMLPVIIVSSRSKEEDRLAGIRVGADAYIVKGQFETRVLLDVVNQFVR